MGRAGSRPEPVGKRRVCCHGCRGRGVVYRHCGTTVCVDAGTGVQRWIVTDDVCTCHGRLALGDVDGDGRPEICLGSEYGDDRAKRLSSVFVVNEEGTVSHRRKGLSGDFGSTPVVLADVNDDGIPEILVAGQNLTWFEPRHTAAIHCFDGQLRDVCAPVPTGTPRFTVGDFDGDGRVETVGTQDYRDGGPLQTKAIFCADPKEGRIKWVVDVPRIWLTGDPIAVDVDGDGRPEIVLTTNYPSGYAHQPGTAPSGDLYILRASGKILLRQTFPDAIMAPIAVGMGDSGHVSLVLPCYDGYVYVMRTRGLAGKGVWPCPQGNPQRTGTLLDE